MFVFGIPLSFFLPLVVHVWAGLTTVITGIVAFSMPKRRGRHPRWGARYLWAYTLVFLTAAILSGERFIYGFGLEARRDKETDEIGNHQRHNDGIIARHLEDHDDGRHRDADNAGEGRAHAH